LHFAYNIGMSEFSERLKELLIQNNITQKDLSEKINKSRVAVNNYCTGYREPSLDTLKMICQALNESADYLLGLKDI